MGIQSSASAVRLAAWTAAATLVLLAWDFSGLDLLLAHASGGPAGFALRDHWLLADVLHDGGRRAAWGLAMVLCVAVWWPFGALGVLSPSRRLRLAVTTLAAVAAVGAFKAVTRTSCPWDLADFGGVARYAPHWGHLLQPDGGSGRCFPAGHASSGFAFVGGYFAFREVSQTLARRWLWGALAIGLVLGIGQQLRGAHFMSHTLWSAWLCWCVAWAMDAAWAPAGRLLGLGTNSAVEVLQ